MSQVHFQRLSLVITDHTRPEPTRTQANGYRKNKTECPLFKGFDHGISNIVTLFTDNAYLIA